MKQNRKVMSLIMLCVVVIGCLIYMNYYKDYYKISRDSDAKYLYYNINNEAQEPILMSRSSIHNISLNKGDVLTTSLHENIIVAVKWKTEYDSSFINLTNNQVINIKRPAFAIKDGENFARRILDFEILEAGEATIDFNYGSLKFSLELSIAE